MARMLKWREKRGAKMATTPKRKELSMLGEVSSKTLSTAVLLSMMTG